MCYKGHSTINVLIDEFNDMIVNEPINDDYYAN